MFCPKCGKENKEGAKFCMGCGAELPSKPVEEIKVEEAKAPTPNVGKVVAIVVLVLFALFLLIRWGSKPPTPEERQRAFKEAEDQEFVRKLVEEGKRIERRHKYLRKQGLE